jgi:hypothetical protein
LYEPSKNLKKQCVRVFSGKIGESFAFDSPLTFSVWSSFLATQRWKPKFIQTNFQVKTKSLSLTKSKSNKLKKTNFSASSNPSLASFNLTSLGRNMAVFDNSAHAFVSSFIQKRGLHQQNLLVFRMLRFENKTSLKSPPHPPGSSVLGILRRHENLKRNEKSFTQKEKFSIHQKMNFHQQQHLMKALYDQPYSKKFRSETSSAFLDSKNFFSIDKKFSENERQKSQIMDPISSKNDFYQTRFKNSFDFAFKELGYLPSRLLQPTSSSVYYRKTFLMRHRFYFTNQWWNGQLPEQNSESTFLSDVDWRSLFVESLGDLTLDFPDADQHYNPRQRRWMLHSGYWTYWFGFQKSVQAEIQNHFVQECFNESFGFLNQHREILDALTYFFLIRGFLNESRFLTILARF